MKYTLYNGDCLMIMKDIPDKSINMICCDLPYGTTKNQWDSIIPLDKLWSEYSRIAKDDCAIVLFSQPPFDKVLGNSNLQLLKYEWIWEKENGTGFLNAKRSPLKIHENILVFYKKQPTYNPQMRLGFKPYSQHSGKASKNYSKQVVVETISNGERFPIDILRYSRDKSKMHPTPKPVALIEYLIRTYTNENELVLDNCMGSGTCGVACVRTNRNFIGIEKDEHYFEVAKSRIENCKVEELF